MSEAKLQIEIKKTKEEIKTYMRMISVTQELIELNNNKDKWGNNHYLSDYNEEYENMIRHHREAINNRLGFLLNHGVLAGVLKDDC